MIILGQVNYPYIPEGREIRYVGLTNHYMLFARWWSRRYSLDSLMPTGAVLVRGGKILGAGANGNSYHSKNKCRRVLLGSKTGEGYELCEGCHPRNHSELRAIAYARKKGLDVSGSDLYLWGHWWCCHACWSGIVQSGIEGVFLLEKSEVLFNKEHPENIVGRQFDL